MKDYKSFAYFLLGYAQGLAAREDNEDAMEILKGVASDLSKIESANTPDGEKDVTNN